MESLIQDYRTVDGVNIAHSGKTSVSLFRFGESSETHSRTRMEEEWEIDEVDFNIKGLSMDCFLPPGDLKTNEEEGSCGNSDSSRDSIRNNMLPLKIIRSGSARFSVAKIVAIDDDDEVDDDDGL